MAQASVRSMVSAAFASVFVHRLIAPSTSGSRSSLLSVVNGAPVTPCAGPLTTIRTETTAMMFRLRLEREGPTLC